MDRSESRHQTIFRCFPHPRGDRSVRVAIPSDIPFIEGIAARLYAKNQHCFPGIPYCSESTRKYILETMEDPRGIVLVSETSMCGGMLVPFRWNTSVLVGQVVFWGFNSHRGVGIIKVMAGLLREAGATHFTVASHWPEFRSARLYSRIGLQPCELSCIGRLE